MPQQQQPPVKGINKQTKTTDKLKSLLKEYTVGQVQQFDSKESAALKHKQLLKSLDKYGNKGVLMATKPKVVVSAGELDGRSIVTTVEAKGAEIVAGRVVDVRNAQDFLSMLREDDKPKPKPPTRIRLRNIVNGCYDPYTGKLVYNKREATLDKNEIRKDGKVIGTIPPDTAQLDFVDGYIYAVDNNGKRRALICNI